MSLEIFESQLEDELSWRKSEVSKLILCIQEPKNESAKKEIAKAIILFIYAHWEGFIKNSSKLYLNYVSKQKKSHRDLLDNFLAISLKGVLKSCVSENNSISLSHELKLMSTYTTQIDKNFNQTTNIASEQDNSIINTNSNLNVKTLKKISEIIGVTSIDYMIENISYIDTFLLARRNKIGHGGKLESSSSGDNLIIEIQDVQKIRDIILLFLDSYKEDLLKYSEEEFYLKENNVQKKIYDDSRKEEVFKKLESIEQKYN